MVPNAARKAIARRQEMVAKADEAALRGQRLFADEDYEGAVSEFRKALDLLPAAPVVEERRREYTALFADASVALAAQYAEEGRYSEAISLVEAVLEPGVDPENPKARQLLADLNDPEVYSPAITPEHIERVKRVELALKTAEGHIRIGDYDGAERKYHEVLNYDPYNSAARRGLEEVERHRRIYYDTAYDHTRGKFLNEIAKQWESTVPRFSLEGEELVTDLPTTTGTGVDYINEKLKRIIIPEIEFEDTPLSVAIDYLRQKSRELDDLEPDPTRKGINIIIRKSGTTGGGGAGLGGGDDDLGFDDPLAGDDTFGGAGGEPTVSLKLSNVPLVEALRYTTEIAGMTYKVEPNAVLVVPVGQVSNDLYTQVFRVPPSFLVSGGDGGGDGGAVDDPFADLGDTGGGGGGLTPRKSAKEILEGVGVSFPQGSSAIYNPTTSQLIVRNTQSNLDLVEAYVDSLKVDVQKQIYITTKFVEIAQDNDDTFGFDWTLGTLGLNDRILLGGGTLGSNPTPAGDFPFNGNFVGDTLAGHATTPVTSALRSGAQAISGNSVDAAINAATIANIAADQSLAPGVLSMAGVLTNPQFQVVLRAISQHKAADLLSAPSVVARSGQLAKIEVIREFIYPTEYDPPEIPDTSASGDIFVSGSDVVVSTGSPVTPANPAAFETRNLGVTLEVDPVIGADGFTIDLNLNPEVVEFDGFINYGSPIQDPGTGVVLTENAINMPVFSTRRVATSLTIWDGQTVAVGGLIREDVQHVQDKVPVIGDVPFLGQLFRTESEVRMKRNLTVFVTARLIDPAGVPINEDVSGPIETIDPTGAVK